MHLLIYYNMGTNTGIGIGIGIPFKNNALGGDRPYLPPELKARLIGVWDNYGKKNTDADRNIIKNKIPNAGGDLEILNAAYKLNSGFGEYKEDFTSWRIYPNIEVTDNVITTNGNFNSTWFIYKQADENEINEMNIKVSGIPEGGKILYLYIPDETATIPVSYNISEDGVYHLPKSKLSSNRVSVGFTVSSSYDWNNIRIEQLSDFGGAFVTDGVNDIIISQKTLQEMGVTKDFTIVSMIHQISWRGSDSVPLTNYIKPTDNIYVRNQVADIGKTGIYGYVIYDVNNTSVNNSRIINTVLGDKNDYSIYTVGNLSQGKFSVQGYISSKGNIIETSRVAHYWTFALLGKATEDDINLIIAYFNLDRTLKPDIRCNIERQGITNDNHADFNDRLIDYSGNGRDIQMYNLAWKGGSGIAAKQYETFKDWTSESSSTSIIKQIDEFTRIVESITNGYWVSRIRRDSDLDKVYSPINVYLYQDNNFLVHECEYEVDGVKYAIPINEPVGKGYHKLEMYTKDRYTELPENAENVVLSEWYFPKSTKGSIKYSIIPSCKGGILLDGINDFGKVINMPIYKDYTFIIDREIISIGNTAGIVASKSEDSTDVNKQGAFLFECLGAPNNISAWSFYKDNGKVANTDFTRDISYQSKYSYNGIELLAGTALDSDKLWLGILRDKDSRFANVAIYSLMSFPYTMSKFLIERQLKKHKLGTLYPNMVEFRPIAKSNIPYKQIDYFIRRSGVYVRLNPGDYFQSTEDIIVRVTPIRDWQLDVVSSIKVNGKNEVISVNSSYAQTAPIHIDKSPQKIDITIDEYIRYEDIVRPYPAMINLKQDGKTITWGDKLKVGSEVTFVNHTNLLPDLYDISGGVQYNGTYISWNTSIRVEKSMVFVNPHIYKKANEPSCILSPNRLRIPNSSYKILGYIPDLTGKGNHGKLNNFAYTEDSGVASDGSIKIDGTDDHITISNIIGGKCIMAKVTVNRNSGIIYDQRRANVPNKSWMQLNPSSVIFEQNAVSTYIDGILNHNVTGSDLVSKTVNLTCELEIGDTSGTYQPTIGSSYAVGYTTDINLYEFMLFPDVPDEKEIKKLNDIIGIEGGYVESPNYYWDSFGKKNTDTDRNLIADQVSKDVANALEVKNVAYNSESGYTDDNGLLLDGVEDHAINTVISAVTDFTVIAKRTDLRIIDDLTSSFIQKGLSAVWNVGGAFSEGRTEADKQYCSTFGNSNDISNVYNKEFFYETKNSYNGKAITIRTDKTDSNGLSIGAIMNNGSALGGYWKGIFYKLMFYTKTINQLSINMLKNLFERDELIDITNPIFKKKEL